MDISLKGKGAIPRKADARDIIYRDYIAGFSPIDWDVPYDVRDKIGELPVNDQGQGLSCTGQASSKLAEIANAFEIKQVNHYVRLSARDIYSRIFISSGGAYGFKALSKIVERGVATENRVPSGQDEQSMRVQDNSPSATEEALIYQAKSYAFVSANIDEMALAIKNQNGIVFGVIGTNGGWSGDRPRYPQPGEEVWYHFITGIGYKLIGGKKHIVILNSWGEEWGDNGYGYISEDYIAWGWTFNAMTLLDLPNPPEKIFMKRVVRLDGTQDQYILESGRKVLIPDLETRAFYRDVLKIIPDSEPEVIQKAEFDSYMESEPLSMGVMRATKNAYPFFKDAFEKNQ